MLWSELLSEIAIRHSPVQSFCLYLKLTLLRICITTCLDRREEVSDVKRFSCRCRSRPLRKGSLFVFRLGFKFFAFRLRALHLNALEDTRLDYESRIKMMQESHRKDIEAIKSSTGYVRSVESRHEMFPNLLLSNFLSRRRPIINELTVIRYNHQSATTLCKPAVYVLF